MGDGKGKKNGHVVEEAPIAAEAKPEKKKSDVGKPTKEDDPKPASEPEAEKTKKSSGGGVFVFVLFCFVYDYGLRQSVCL